MPERLLNCVDSVALSRLTPGTIVRARIPFAEPDEGQKVRPALVVERTGRTVTVVPIHSSRRTRRQRLWLMVPTALELGLPRSSCFCPRLVDLDRMDAIEILATIGMTSPGGDEDRNAQALMETIVTWVQAHGEGPDGPASA